MSLFVGLTREPLLHFLGMGVLLFGISALRTPDAEREIVVTPALREELRRELTDERGKAPSAAELEQALRQWKREEVLYREGVQQGLDRNDAQVRARVIAKVVELQRSLLVAPKPRPEELDAWLERHRARYELPVRYDFEHVFASKDRRGAESRARELAQDLERGKLVLEVGTDLGDRFEDGRAFTAQTPERIERVFGERFASAFPTLQPGRWTVLESSHGWHAVRLRLAEGGLPPREALGSRLIEDFQAAALEAALARYTANVETQYRFREEP